MQQRSTIRGRFSHQLYLTAALKSDVPPGSGVDGITHCQEAMILQNNGFVITQCFGDSGAFLQINSDTTKIGIDGMVILKSTDILCDRIEFAT